MSNDHALTVTELRVEVEELRAIVAAALAALHDPVWHNANTAHEWRVDEARRVLSGESTA